MKKIFVALLLATSVSGCAGAPEYAEVITTPAPQGVAGVWQSAGPQKALVSPDAMASFLVSPQGKTVDCRQWERTIANPGKLIIWKGELYNINAKNELFPISITQGTMHYGNLNLVKVKEATEECSVQANPVQAVNPKPQSAHLTERHTHKKGIGMSDKD
ncbi:hypothetical protein [Biostraticola tofi]|uniref:YedD-like protein n=1 Tax=Biostraticola tofi TaxID=466109 RepID=A0A4R3YZF6_9GAMM|nr:hypothetical protein [Biostraticola tofi]TCV97952.1 YedD-like protein [Biostraticola tofi]